MLAVMNDILSKDSVQLELFKVQPGTEKGRKYTFYSLGLMIGVVAICLNIAVAAIAAANAALACSLSMRNSTKIPRMGERAVFCMVLLFVAFCASGASLVFLCVDFDIAFTIAVVVVYFGGLSLAPLQLVDDFWRDMDWVFGWREDPLRFVSCSGLGPVFALAVARPAPPSWYPLLMATFTLTHHRLSSLTGRLAEGGTGDKRRKPLRLAAFGGALALAWAGCAVVTATWGVWSHKVDRWVQWLLVAIASLEAILMGVHAAVAAHDWWKCGGKELFGGRKR